MDFISAEPEEFPRQGLHSAQLKFIMRVSLMYAMLLLVAVGVFAANTSFGQEPENRMTTIGMENETLAMLFTKLRAQTGLSFVFSRKVAEYRNINLPRADRTVKEVLDIVLKGTGLTYRFKGNKVFVFENVPEVDAVSTSIESLPQFPVNGLVTDTHGTPLVGVSIIVMGTMRGTTTDANGQYAIDVGEGEVLLFSFIGFKTIEIVIAKQTHINVLLENDVTSLKEVTINAGYYDVKEKEKTGSISKVHSEAIGKQPVTNPLGALQGRMPGVYIQQTAGTPGSEFNIQIRGRNSLRDDGNQPLYIVDGVPFSMEKTFSVWTSGNFGASLNSSTSPVSPLTSINLSDIESIEVLKDADATAIYGSRGANGVVLITTKKARSGKTAFDVNVYTGVGKAPQISLLSTQQFLSLRREAFKNDGLTPSAVPGDPGYSPELMIWDTTRYTDWQNKLMGGLAEATSVQASLSGGSERTQLLFSLGYRRENSVYIGDMGYQKLSFHQAVNHKSSNDRFSVSLSINGTNDKNNQLNADFNRIARSLAPNAPRLYNDEGELNWENSTWDNPLARLKNRYINRVINFMANTILEYEIAPGLKIKTSAGVNYLSSKEVTKYPHDMYDPALSYTSAQSRVRVSSGANQSWIIEPQLSYERKILKGNLSLQIGSTFQEQQLDRRADDYLGFPDDALLDNISTASNASNFEFIQSIYRYAAIFGRLNYNWNGKYILNLTARRDGSSRFGPGKRFASFGAIGAAWIFSEENFIKDNFSFISFAKLRTSYGSAGNDQIGNYQYFDTYAGNMSATGSSQYQGVTWLGPTKLFNPDYAWEVNRKFEATLELGFLSDRLSITCSYFDNRSSNQLVNYSLPTTTGFTGILANLPATVQNMGVEIELTKINVQSSTFQWSTSFNVTIPRNRLIEFPNLESSTYASEYVVGEPLSISKVYESTGVDSENGMWTFTDVNGDGVISRPEDNIKLMFLGQDFYGGLSNELKWKRWVLDVLFQFVRQNGVKSWGTLWVPGRENYNIPAFIVEKSIWRKPGDIAEIQKIVTEKNTELFNLSRNYVGSDAMYGDASFIRLKNISLSYQIPERFTKNLKCRLYFQGQNLLLITRYEGADPENQRYNSLSPLKMFTTGVQLSF